MEPEPSRCPNPRCRHHVRRSRSPARRFYWRKGSFPRRRAAAVRRYQCRACGQHFSDQTFRGDYREKRPDYDLTLLALQRRGASIRAAARLMGIDRRTVARRFRRAAAAAALRPGPRRTG
jgi:transposase-like protein